MDADGTPKDDVKVPESDIGKEISCAFEDGKDVMVTIIAAMGEWCLYPANRMHRHMLIEVIIDEEQAISWKEAPQEK